MQNLEAVEATGDFPECPVCDPAEETCVRFNGTVGGAEVSYLAVPNVSRFHLVSHTSYDGVPCRGVVLAPQTDSLCLPMLLEVWALPLGLLR